MKVVPLKIVITGATGFVGSNLSSFLVEQGHSITAIVRPKSDLSLIKKQITPAIYDGTFDSLQKIISNAQPELVIHLSSKFIAEHSTADLEPLLEANIRFPLMLLEAMEKFGCRKLLNAGTSWQHFSGPEYDPVCLYAATKQAFEDLLRYYVEAKGFSAVTLKLCDTYGVNDNRKKLFSALFQAVRTSTPLAMSPGNQLINLTYIDDVVSAFTAAIQFTMSRNFNEGKEFMVRSSETISLRELVSKFEAELGESVPISWGEREYRTREVMRPWLELSSVPGWTARVTLVEGIQKIVKEHSIINGVIGALTL